VTVGWERLGQNRRVELTTLTRGNGTWKRVFFGYAHSNDGFTLIEL